MTGYCGSTTDPAHKFSNFVPIELTSGIFYKAPTNKWDQSNGLLRTREGRKSKMGIK